MSRVGFEALLRRDRYVVLAAVLVVTALAWGYLVWLNGHVAMPIPQMAGMAMDGMEMNQTDMGTAMTPAATPWATDLLLAFIMWAVMMVGMMTPSVTPVILLYARVGRRAASDGTPFAATGCFVAGYFLAWTGFSLVAASAQLALRKAALLSPMLLSENHFLGAAILIVAGIYQWSPLKNACLAQCRAPLHFIQRHGGFKANAAESLALGLRHGLYCTGCCWAIMLLLFVGGVMNLLWVAGLAVLVLMEKIPAQGRFFSRATGTVLIAGSLLQLWRGLHPLA
jgi:predicted metal-binding membrane protein